MRWSEARERIHEALALRLSCLQLYTTTPSPSAMWLDGAGVSRHPTRAWELLLQAECAALPIGRLLRRHRLMECLSFEVRECLAEAERRETQRILAGRAVLRELSATAADAGVRITILKGGAALAEPNWFPVDLGDIDILVRAAEGASLWRALLRRGWTTPASTMIQFPEMSREESFVSLQPPGFGLPVDFHQAGGEAGHGAFSIGDEDRRPLPGYAALDRPTGARALLDLLRHSTVGHPFRRGHLRDLSLLAQFASELSEPQRVALVAHLAAERSAIELGDLLSQVLSLVDGRLPRDSAATRRFVAWKYDSVLKDGGLVARVLPAWALLSQIALERPAMRRNRFVHELHEMRRLAPGSVQMRTARHRGVMPDRLQRWARMWYRVTLLAVVGCIGWRIRRRYAEFAEAGRSAR